MTINNSNPSGLFGYLGGKKFSFAPPHGGIFIGNISSSEDL
jgi:hypothetical protein